LCLDYPFLLKLFKIYIKNKELELEVFKIINTTNHNINHYKIYKYNKIKNMTEKIIVANKGPVRAEFAFWVGRYMDKFFDVLENKRIIGNKCPKCGDVFVPPRKICGKCNIKIDFEKSWVDLPDTGILKNYTITYYKVNDRASRKVKKPQIVGMIQIDGSNTSIVYRLLDLEPEDVKIGMKLKIQWEEKPKGDPSDIKGFIKI